MASPTQTLRYTPHARQLAVHEAPEGDVWACMGYGTGKTELAVFEALNMACVTHPGCEGIVAAPTHALLVQSWLSSWRRLIPSAWYEVRGNNDRIEVHTDQGVSTVWLRSTVNLRSIEGINAGWLVYDEATRETSPDPIRVLAARLRRGYPGRQRRKLIIGPPMTRSHWTAEDYGAGPDAKHQGDARSWCSTEPNLSHRRRVVRGRTRDNPYLPPDYEPGLRARPGASRSWCKQWLDAEFGSIEGQIYEAFSRDVHVVPARSLEGRAWRETIGAIDWGWTHPGVLLTVSTDGAALYVTHEEVHKGKVVADIEGGWIPLLRAEARRAKMRRLFGDPSQPANLETVARFLKRPADRTEASVSCLVYPANNEVGEGIRRVQAALEWALERSRGKGAMIGTRALYVSDACPFTIAQFESYRRRRERDGTLAEDPLKREDDTMDALRYAVMELTNG